MTKLYSELANAYYEMYQSLFDYEKEFALYDGLLQKYGYGSVLDVGCGNGKLAPLLLKAGYAYTGLDLFDEMLKIARRDNPGVLFRQGDMRDLRFDQEFDAIIIPGRSFCYMTTNEDLMNSLKSIYDTLKKDGILIFDNFRAEAIFADFSREMEHQALYQTRKYTRTSTKTPNLKTGWTWNWHATYRIEEEGKETKIVRDESVLRAFTKDELRLFLGLNHFTVLEILEDNTAFTTVARK